MVSNPIVHLFIIKLIPPTLPITHGDPLLIVTLTQSILS